MSEPRWRGIKHVTATPESPAPQGTLLAEAVSLIREFVVFADLPVVTHASIREFAESGRAFLDRAADPEKNSGPAAKLAEELREVHDWHADSYSGAWPEHLDVMKRSCNKLLELARAEVLLRDIWDTVPAEFNGPDAERHARALNNAGRFLKSIKSENP